MVAADRVIPLDVKGLFQILLSEFASLTFVSRGENFSRSPTSSSIGLTEAIPQTISTILQAQYLGCRVTRIDGCLESFDGQFKVMQGSGRVGISIIHSKVSVDKALTLN